MDGPRSLALAGACTAFIAVPNLGALLGPGEQTDRYDTAITPPGYAFAVWAPIFTACAASTIAQCRSSARHSAVSRRTGWPLAAAYAANTAWSLAAQSNRFALTPYLLPVAATLAATAHLRLQRLPAGPGPTTITATSTGLLLGWTALASVVNVVAARPSRNTPRTVPAATAALLATAAAVTTAVTRSRRGGRAVALTSAWGLATLAATRRRPTTVRAAATTGAAAITAAALTTATDRGRR
ncbi:hypothetical protein ACFY36_31900 [Actinoplanes sp. NPDC000266]